MTPEEADRLALASIWWAQPHRQGPMAHAAISVLAGERSGLSREDRLDVCSRLAAAEALSAGELEGRMAGLAGKSAIEHKILGQVERKSLTATDVTTELDAALGSFSGYLATFARDAGGDTISRQALDGTVADFTAGRRRWLLTEGHSDSASDVVAEVDTARLDSVGLLVTAKWLGSDRAQTLRQMVLDGARLGMSIDYSADALPDGRGGRVLTRVDVYGGAITSKPMNGQAIITEGKTAAGGTVALGAPIVGLYEDAQARHRGDPALERKARVVAASWVSPALAASIGTEAAFGLVEGAAKATAARQLEGDPERSRAQASRDWDNVYCNGLAESMARLAVDGCGICWRCRIGGACIHAR